MPKIKQFTTGERINLHLPASTTEKLNAYCMKVFNKEGKIPFGIKTAIGRRAIDEWLNVHSDEPELIIKIMKEPQT